ncbi:MAG: hypothetical protein AB7Y74_15880, partial [Syntrophorhabdus sp.]
MRLFLLFWALIVIFTVKGINEFCKKRRGAKGVVESNDVTIGGARTVMLRVEINKKGKLINIIHYSDEKVTYNRDGSITTVGDVDYKYFIDGDIQGIGEVPFDFHGKTLNSIGKAVIHYNSDGDVIEVGEDPRVKVVVLSGNQISDTDRPNMVVHPSASDRFVISDPQSSQYAIPDARTRYKDGYSVARQIIAYGTFVKTIGVLLGIGIFIGSIFIARSQGGVAAIIGGVVI